MLEVLDVLYDIAAVGPHYAALLGWLVSYLWVARAIGTQRRDMFIVGLCAIVSWFLPVVLSAVARPWISYKGGSGIIWSVSGTIVFSAVIYSCSRLIGQLRLAWSAAFLFLPIWFSIGKLTCFFNGCCGSDISVAAGVIEYVPVFGQLSEPRDPAQFYEAIGYLVLGGLFWVSFRYLGPTLWWVGSAVFMLICQILLLQFFRDGLSGSSQVVYTPLHHPFGLIAVGGALLIVLFVTVRDQERRALSLLCPNSLRPRPISRLGGTILLTTLTVLVAWLAHKGHYSVRPHMMRPVLCEAFPKGVAESQPEIMTSQGGLAVIASNYNRFSGYFSWEKICRWIGCTQLKKRNGQEFAFAEWPSYWDLDPYTQIHIADLIEAYHVTAQDRYLAAAIQDVDLWLTWVDEENGNIPVWPGNLNAIGQRSQCWVDLLDVLSQRRLVDKYAGFVDAVRRRVYVYHDYLLSIAKGKSTKHGNQVEYANLLSKLSNCCSRLDLKRHSAEAINPIVPKEAGQTIQRRGVARGTVEGETGQRDEQYYVLDASAAKHLQQMRLYEIMARLAVFLWWFIFCVSVEAFWIYPSFSSMLFPVSAVAMVVAAITEVGLTIIVVAGILCIVIIAWPSTVRRAVPSSKRGHFVPVVVYLILACCLIDRRLVSRAVTATESGTVQTLARQVIDAWMQEDVAQLERLTWHDHLSPDQFIQLMRLPMSMIRFSGNVRLERLIWRSRNVVSAVFVANIATLPSGSQMWPQCSGFLAFPVGQKVLDQHEATRHIILVKRGSEWRVAL